ncbi:MAG: hypothetical protein HW380_993 [Magnetococcales bacterium]|nr:hypothetical protein [Magnetococcales bacterium]
MKNFHKILRDCFPPSKSVPEKITFLLFHAHAEVTLLAKTFFMSDSPPILFLAKIGFAGHAIRTFHVPTIPTGIDATVDAIHAGNNTDNANRIASLFPEYFPTAFEKIPTVQLVIHYPSPLIITLENSISRSQHRA